MDAAAFAREVALDRRQRTAAAGTQVHDRGRARGRERVRQQRDGRLVQREPRLEEVQVVGRQVADDRRKPRLILQLERLHPAHQSSPATTAIANPS